MMHGKLLRKYLKNSIYPGIAVFIMIIGGFIFAGCSYDEFSDDAVETGNYSISAIRYENETFEQASTRNKMFYVPPEEGIYGQSVSQAARPLAQIDFRKVPDWGQSSKLVSAFNEIRDERFLIWFNWLSYFPRRLFWLYPDNGCWIRADTARARLEGSNYPDTMKLFIFGNLKVFTKNHPNGFVQWWFHVVPVASVNGTPMVFDPAINPSEPMTVQEWIGKMDEAEDASKFTFSLCHSHAYWPYSSCENPTSVPNWLFMSSFLRSEWNRIESLGRDPKEELGDNPPWR